MVASSTLRNSLSFAYDSQRHKQEMSQVTLLVPNPLNYAPSDWTGFVCSGTVQGWSPFVLGSNEPYDVGGVIIQFSGPGK